MGNQLHMCSSFKRDTWTYASLLRQTHPQRSRFQATTGYLEVMVRYSTSHLACARICIGKMNKGPNEYYVYERNLALWGKFWKDIISFVILSDFIFQVIPSVCQIQWWYLSATTPERYWSLQFIEYPIPRESFVVVFFFFLLFSHCRLSSLTI